MEAVPQVQLAGALKETTLAIINQLVAHNVKGADLIAKGIGQMTNLMDEAAKWYDLLKNLLLALKPVFELVRDWLVEAYQHLVVVFDWAKEMWHKIFGPKD